MGDDLAWGDDLFRDTGPQFSDFPVRDRATRDAPALPAEQHEMLFGTLKFLVVDITFCFMMPRVYREEKSS